MSTDMAVVDAVFSHYFDSCQISSLELDRAYMTVCDSVSNDELAVLIDNLCLACERAAFKAGIKAGFMLSQELM